MCYAVDSVRGKVDMGYQIPPGYGLFTLKIRNGSFPAYSVRFGLNLTNAPTLVQADMDRISNTVRDVCKTEYDAGWTLGDTTLLYAPFVLNSLFVLNDGTTEPGTAVAQIYTPPAVSWILQKRSVLAGKKGRGRMYMPGLEEPNVDEGGAILAAKVTNANTMGALLLTSLAADAAVDFMCLLHQDDPVTTPVEVTQLIYAPICGTQRPRQRRS